LLRGTADNPRDASHQHREWLLEELLDRREKLGACRPINDAMVTRQREFHALAGNDLTILHDGHVSNAADGKDTGVRGIDYGREFLDAEHTEVARREGRPFPFVRLQLSVSGFLSQLLRLGGNLAKTFAIGVADDGGNESLIDSHRDRNVNVVVASDLAFAFQECSVVVGMPRQGDDARLLNQIVVRYFDAAVG